MQNIQDIVNKIGEQKFAKVPSERVGHYWGEKMIAWRHSEENRLRNQGQWRHNQKLTPQQAEEIRRLHWEDNLSITELSFKYKITNSSIRKILNNKRFYNANTPYIGVKFRKTRKGQVSKKKLLVNVYDENGNFLEQDTQDGIAAKLGITILGFRNIFNKNKSRFHKKSKKYFFRDYETPIFVL